MTTNNWSYEELGFNSESEMQDSIARVQRKKNMSEFEIGLKNRNSGSITPSGGVNLAVMKEGARLDDLDRKVHNKLIADREFELAQAEHKKMQELMSSLSKRVESDKKAKVEKEFEERKAKAEAELQEVIYNKYHVTTDEEADRRKRLLNLIDGAIGKSE